MNDSHLDARRVGLGLRPPRLAVLIGSNCDWGHCVYLIGTLTQIWGGVAYAIVPTDGETISPLFWRLLKRYDPDWIARYGDTVNVSESLSAELTARLSLAQPIGQHLDVIWPDNIGWPLTQIHECLPDDGVVTPVRDLKIEGDLLAQTLVYASSGYLHKGEREGLERNGVQIVDEEIALASGTANLLQLCNDLWVARQRRRDASLPLSLSLRYVGSYFTDMPSRCAVVAVCGDTLGDFALFWTLRALRGTFASSNVFWFPSLPDKSDVTGAPGIPWLYLAHAVAGQLREVWGDKRVLATSLSIPLSSLTQLGAVLDKAAIGTLRSEQTKSAAVEPDDFAQLLPYETHYWELNNTPRENGSVVQFLDGRGLAILDTPIPKKVTVTHESNMRWMVDAEVEGLRVPVRSSLMRLLIEPERLSDFRVSRRGATYQAISAWSEPSQTVEAKVVRPRLRLPTDWQVFQALGGEAGLSFTLSDKGQFEREFIRMLGDLPAVGRHLRHPGVVRTLCRFIDKTPNKKGVFDEGVAIGDRRYLSLDDVTKLWDDDQDASKLVDSYLQGGVLQRGMLIRCPHCRKSDWYPLRELSDKVVCHRCSREHVFSAHAAVYFRLDEIAAEVLENNSHIPLLALNCLRRRSKISFLYSTDCEVRRDGEDEEKPWLEIDLLAVVDGDLVVGECKSGAKLETSDKAQFKKYVDLCARLRPDRFVVATDAPEWGKGSTQFLDNLQPRLVEMDVQLVRLTGVDITWPPTVGETAIPLDQVLSATAVDDLGEEEP